MALEHIIIKNLISKEISEFLFSYLNLKKTGVKLLREYNIISSLDRDHGIFGDGQLKGTQGYKNTYCIYGDAVFDTLLSKVKPIIEKKLKTKLVETYSYARLYTKGNVLKKHTDRESCEFSITLNLGGSPWPLFLENAKLDTLKINLKPGDALIYQGAKYKHWREALAGDQCGQVFLHYIKRDDQDNKDPRTGKYDFRHSLGLSRQQSDYLIDQIKKQRENN